MQSAVPNPSATLSAHEEPSLDDFFHHIRYSNPFAQDRISDPSEADVDVETIHQAQSNALIRHALAALRQGRGVGVVLWGEAGVGKSHLLARFSRWAEKNDRACYVFLHNIHVEPERLPRYILKAAVSRLTSGRSKEFRNSPLYRLLYGIVLQAIKQFSRSPQSEHTVAEARRCFELYIDEHAHSKLAVAAVDDPTVYRVLFELFVSSYQAWRKQGDEAVAASAVRWLSGDVLDAEEAQRLGVRAEGGQSLASLPDNQAVERVLVVLMELCRLQGKPFILVFDQVENLAPDEIRALVRFCHTLLDHATNLLVVTSGVTKELLEYQNLIGAASWERIAQDKLMPQLIRPEEAQRLLDARLESFFESFVVLPRIKELLISGEMFPLGKTWLDGQIGDALELKPRHVITWARRRWNEQVDELDRLGGEIWLREWAKTHLRLDDRRPPEQIIDEKVEEKLREQIRRRELDPSGLPPDASNLAGLVETLLKQCRGAGNGYTLVGLDHPPGRTKTQKPAYDLLVRERSPNGRDVTTGLTFIVTGSKTSMAASLRRIKDDPQPPEHVLVVCDARQPLHCADKGQEYLDRLTERGPDRFQVMELSFPQYAELDALEAVVGEARSGDLEATFAGQENRPLTPNEVVASHHRRGRYLEHRLLRELLCEAPLGAEPVVVPRVDRDEIRQFIRAQLALTMGLSSIELTQKYCAGLDGKGAFAFDAVKARLEEIALEMHHEELLVATPTGDYLFLLNRPGR